MLIYMVMPVDNGNEPRVESYLFQDDGTFPNNRQLPLIVLYRVFPANPQVNPTEIEKVFNSNSWVPAWRNGLFSFHHYHSTAHETLGIYKGWIEAQFGGPDGKVLQATAGDVLIVPAGVSHKNVSQSSDFQCVGAYPKGQSSDMNCGKPTERPSADRNIQRVELPVSDPVFGMAGPLTQFWH